MEFRWVALWYPFAKSAKDGADTAGRTDVFTRGSRNGAPELWWLGKRKLRGEGSERILDRWSATGGYVTSPEFMELRQYSVRFGQSFDPPRIGLELDSRNREDGHIIGEYVEISPRPATAET